MQPATDSTVLGAFNNVSFTSEAATSTFFRAGPKFMVRTDGPDGALHDYEIKYTFGVYPLQQYLIAMPGGRLQALGIAWDSRPLDKGGQRWFFLLPGRKIAKGDPLHWTGIDQTWNFMCADCHSTNVRKNYNARTRSFSTSYSEIDVSCEACHGPGSDHLAWATRQGDWSSLQSSKGLLISLDERQGASWSVDPVSGDVRRSRPRESEREIQMCARCHSRRAQIHENYVHGQPVGDDYRVAFLDQDLYFPDGQIKGEDYEYGSFIQSRMFHSGVTSSDCHEPHSLKLRAAGNGICLQCHSARRYESPKHHFHKSDSAGARCVNCHMPTRTYMVVDPRRDHSLRVPRPDLSVKLSVPNACTNCHTDKSSQWASDSIDKWYGRGPVGFQHFAQTLHSGIEGAPDARQSLAGLIADREQPAIARATALSMFAAYPPDDTAVQMGIADDSALVRRGAAHALTNSDPRATITILAPLLRDPVRAVRLEAAEVLAGMPPDSAPPDVSPELRKVIDEYIASQELNADRPEAHLNLALLYAKQNHFDEAEAELKTALSLDPTFAPAAVNLADLYREQNRDQEGERVLHEVISRAPNDASLQYALGLLMVRQKRNAQALRLLAAAARLDPGNARYAYVYAVALNDAGQPNAAIAELEATINLHPYDRDSLGALVNYLAQSGDSAKELTYAQRLAELEPDNSELRSLVAQLRSGRKAGTD
ncbi:MAG: tetratricopeptide repeat protein [Candidatus Binataceae bacterium]